MNNSILKRNPQKIPTFCGLPVFLNIPSSNMAAASQLENVNPAVFKQASERDITAEEQDEDHTDKIDDREVFGIL